MTTTNPTIVDSLHATEAAARHDDGIQAKDLRRAAWACSLGSALEYYDFALYTLASALIFGPLFFPEQTPEMRLIASFGTYFLGFAVRLRLKESPTFVKIQEHKRTLDNPLKTVLTHSRRTLLIGVGLRLAENGGSSIYQAPAVSFIVGVIGLEGPVGVITLICAAAVGACTVPVAGKLSDRFGRVAVYRAFAFLQLALAFPVWWVLSQGEVVASVIAISIALGIGTWGRFGTQAALMPELFGAGHRYMGVSVAREASAAVAGGIAPMVGAGIIAAVVALNPDDPQAATGAWFPIACYLALLTLTTIYTTFKTLETLNRDLDDPRDAAHASPAAF
ncbi:MFS transporter [Azorhizophilus paspali]|uniref:MFS transporter n=1 Tax=Azorhizophilus paspali TaxID=69963 RepID=A0ABV6SIR5_AZOPA